LRSLLDRFALHAFTPAGGDLHFGKTAYVFKAFNGKLEISSQ
jgi:hypothetical protein